MYLKKILVLLPLVLLMVVPAVSSATTMSDLRPQSANIVSSDKAFFGYDNNDQLKSHRWFDGDGYFDNSRHHRGPGDFHRPGCPPHRPPSPTPIPSAVWLLGTGIVGLVGIRKRIR